MSLQPSARFNQTVSYDRVEFDRLSDGSRVYTVNVLNTDDLPAQPPLLPARDRPVRQLAPRPVLTDFLASWELLPGTVGLRRVRLAHRAAGLGRQRWSPRDTRGGVYRTTQRGLFFKAAYVHRF